MYAKPFMVHVRNLKILPRSLNEIGASLFIQLECGIGAALVMSAFSAELIPVLIVLIPGLSALTVWGVRSGRIDDCGCYGGWLNLSLKQSLGLNGLYIVMLVLAGVSLDVVPVVPMWKVLVIIGVMALSNFLIRGSANAPLVDLSPLKPGRAWKRKWLNPTDFQQSGSESILFVFMSQRCYRCKDWDPYIINLNETPDLPAPVLIFPETDSELQERLTGIPHQAINPGLFRYMVYQTPTAVLVSGEVITGRWISRFPEEFV